MCAPEEHSTTDNAGEPVPPVVWSRPPAPRPGSGEEFELGEEDVHHIDEDSGDDDDDPFHRPLGFQGAWTPLEMFKERLRVDLPLARRVPGSLFHAFAFAMWDRMDILEQSRYWNAHF